MPIVYSRLPAGSPYYERSLWIDEYIHRREAEILTPTTASFGFKAYIPKTSSHLLALSPAQYFDVFRNALALDEQSGHTNVDMVSNWHTYANNVDFAYCQAVREWTRGNEVGNVVENTVENQVARVVESERQPAWLTPADFAHLPDDPSTHHEDFFKLGAAPTKTVKLAIRTTIQPAIDTSVEPAVTPEPVIDATAEFTQTTEENNNTAVAWADNVEEPTAAAPTANDHFNSLLAKLKPRPFQYVWTVHYDKTSKPATDMTASTYDGEPTIIADDVEHLAAFFKVFNNFLWDKVPLHDTIHFFRLCVKPRWDDPATIKGGSYTFEVRRDRVDDIDFPRKVWKEVCVMTCGGAFQVAMDKKKAITDQVVGCSFTNSGMYVAVSVWLGTGEGRGVVADKITKTFGAKIQEKKVTEGVWAWHRDNEGWEEAGGQEKVEMWG